MQTDSSTPRKRGQPVQAVCANAKCQQPFSYRRKGKTRKFCSYACWVAFECEIRGGGGSPEERFWANVEKTPSCWLWRRGHTYGTLSVNGGTWMAHRFSYHLHRGPIPEGMQVLHNCPGGDDPRCVNPDHLWLGTNAENMADKAAKNRGQTSLDYWQPVGVMPISADVAFLVLHRKGHK